MEITQIIDAIVKIIFSKMPSINNNDLEIHSFKYSKNIKTSDDIEKLKRNQSISIIGHDNIAEYNEYIQMLYSKMNVADKRISLDFFRRTIEQLFFENKFNEDEIKKEITTIKAIQFHHIAKIYGVTIKDEVVKLGKFAFINKEHLVDYIKIEIKPNSDDNDFKRLQESALNKTDEDSNYVFLHASYEVCDPVFCKSSFESDQSRVINVLRYMAGVKHKSVYIDSKQFKVYADHYYQFSANGKLSGGIRINRKDVPIEITSDYFDNKENGNHYIWEILSKDTNSSFEKRITKSIDWIGISIFEDDEAIAKTELAFAFECLLKINENSPIMPSIQSYISESIAFLIGKNCDERKQIVKDFKAFYSYRSSVAHGVKKESSLDYYKYLYMFKDTLSAILTNEKYRSFRNVADLFDDLVSYKFR